VRRLLDPATDRAAELLSLMAAHGLATATGVVPRGPLSRESWVPFLQVTRGERLTGLLVAAVEDGTMDVTDEQAEELSEVHISALGRDLRMERATLEVVDTLDGAGLDHRVLKGPAVAHLDYPDPAQRSFIDVDVLVRSDQWDDAVATLTAIGGERAYPEPRAGWDRRFTKGTTFKMGDSCEVDLHRTVVSGPFGLSVDLESLWEGHAGLCLGGRPLKALPPEARFLQACFSAAVSDVPPRLASLRDIAQMGLGGKVDLGRLGHLTRSSRAEVVVRRAVQLATAALPVSSIGPVGEWVGGLRPGLLQTLVMASYLRSSDRYLSQCLGGVWGIRGTRDRLAYVRGLAFPDRQFVTDRYRGHVDRWCQAASRLVRGHLAA
jgi:hypothetical protein